MPVSASASTPLLAAGKRAFVVQTRVFGRFMPLSLPIHGAPGISVERVRKTAAETIARIRKGQPAVSPEPAPDPTVADLAGRYFREFVEMHCNPVTISHYRLMLRKRAGLEDVRLHDLWDSFASRALALGETLPVIGKLLGHNDIETTARYAHLAQDSIHEAAERIAWSIAADIL